MSRSVGNPPTLAEQLGNLPLYAGYWWDDAIGLYHVRHRVYRPEWGRWLQRDPLGYAPGWNLYQYVNGMPWSAVDPMGLAGTPFEWNHELPQEIFGSGGLLDDLGLAIPGIDDDFINQPKNGSIMRFHDHRGAGNMATHLEYNNAWEQWVRERKEHGPITKKDVVEKLEEFRTSSPYSDWLSKGKRATISYTKWRNKSTIKKLQWLIKEADILTKQEITIFTEVIKAAKNAGTTIKFVHVLSTTANGLGKIATVLVPIVIVANIANGDEVMRATIDGLLPVSIDSVDDLREEGITIIEESVEQKRYDIHRSTDSFLRGFTGIPQNEKIPLFSPKRCDPH